MAGTAEGNPGIVAPIHERLGVPQDAVELQIELPGASLERVTDVGQRAANLLGISTNVRSRYAESARFYPQRSTTEE